MANAALVGWKRLPPDDANRSLGPVADVQYGPDVVTEAELRLLGTLADKRVLELGCGAGQSLVCLSKKGAHTIGLDFDGAQLAAAKRLADAEGVRVELHQGDLADLAFMRGDSVDLVFSAYALGFVQDLNRVFRQVHRVLKEGAPLVFSLPHPVYDLIDHHGQALVIRRSYFDHAPLADGFHHTVSDLFAGLSRAKFRVDVMLEPEPSVEGSRSPFWDEAARWVPRTLVIRARKEGI
ncbi:MAG: hypothetical protein QOE93_427 [Actinomycetota bacterium]|nr:hypothetical protein [Actinomycetota bacterium]